jgi:hypothetical protein
MKIIRNNNKKPKILLFEASNVCDMTEFFFLNKTAG